VKAEHSDTSDFKQMQEDSVKIIEEWEVSTFSKVPTREQKLKTKKSAASSTASAIPHDKKNADSGAKRTTGDSDAYNEQFRAGESTMPASGADWSKVANDEGTRRYSRPSEEDEAPRPDMTSRSEFQYQKQKE